MERFSFNLITQPWVPCLTQAGDPIQLGLLETLAQAHTLQDISTPVPVVKASLYRLLLCILGRVFGPAGQKEWAALWKRSAFDQASLQAYFQLWEPRFDLFHPGRPFFQSPDERVKPKQLLKMVPHLSSGNNATLFDHSTEARGVTFTPAEAARYIVALQYHALGGLSGLPEKFTSAPAGRGISFFVQGASLFQTLLLNLVPPYGAQVHSIPTREELCDLPAWEMEDPFEDRSTPYGWFDYFTWQNRRVLLFPEDADGQVVVRQMTEGPGLRLDSSFLDGVTRRDPFQCYRQGSQGPLVLRFSEDRAVWRDSSALLQFAPDKELPAPANLGWLHLLADQDVLDHARFQVQALGMASDKAKILFYGDERFPLPSDYLADIDLVEPLQSALLQAENLSKSLYASSMHLAETILSFDAERTGRKPDKAAVQSLQEHLRADRVFWSGLEPAFYRLIEDVPMDANGAILEWEQTLRRQGWAALDHSLTLAGDDIRARKAAVGAGAILGATMKKVLKAKEA